MATRFACSRRKLVPAGESFAISTFKFNACALQASSLYPSTELKTIFNTESNPAHHDHARLHLQGCLRPPHQRRDPSWRVHAAADPRVLPSRHGLQGLRSADPADARDARPSSPGHRRARRLLNHAASSWSTRRDSSCQAGGVTLGSFMPEVTQPQPQSSAKYSLPASQTNFIVAHASGLWPT
jgi:hypothetical protein